MINEPAATPTEVQTPTEAAPVEQQPPPSTQPSHEDVLTQIAEAHAASAPKKEIERLEALLEEPAAEPEPEKPAEPEPSKEPAPEPETPTGEQPTEPVEPKEPDRFRFKDAEDRAVAQIAKAKGISLVAAAKLYAGEPSVPAAEPAPQIPEPPAQPPALAAIDTEIASNEAKLADIEQRRLAYVDEPDVFEKELIDLALEESRALLAITKAQGKRNTVELAENQRATSQQTREEHRQIELEAAVKVYPDLADAETPLWMLTAQLSQKWRAAGDPKADDVRACADEAAKRLNLKAVAKPAEPAPSPSATAPKPPGPAPGTRSSAPAPVAKSAAEVTAEAEGRAMAAALGERYVPGRSYDIPVEVR